MFCCELCGKDTGGKEPTANWTLTETFGDLTFTFIVSATKKLCDACIKSFVVTKTETLEVKPPELPPPPEAPEEPVASVQEKFVPDKGTDRITLEPQAFKARTRGKK